MHQTPCLVFSRGHSTLGRVPGMNPGGSQETQWSISGGWYGVVKRINTYNSWFQIPSLPLSSHIPGQVT